MKKYIKFNTALVILLTSATLFSSCKVEDPWVDNTASPLLVDIVGAPFGYPQEKEPTVKYIIADGASIVLSARLLELDKTNILNHEIGIDSIPVAGVKMAVSLRTGAALGEMTSDASGLVTLQKSWADLGVATPVKGTLIKLSWTGSYKGITFTRFSQVQAQ